MHFESDVIRYVISIIRPLYFLLVPISFRCPDSFKVQIRVFTFLTSNLFLLPDLSAPATADSSSISIAAAILLFANAYSYNFLERIQNSIHSFYFAPAISSHKQ